MESYEFEELDDPDMDERDEFLAHVGAFMNIDYNWQGHPYSQYPPREHYFEKEFTDDDGNDITVSINAKTGGSGTQDKFAYSVTTDPSDADVDDYLEEWEDCLEKAEEKLS